MDVEALDFPGLLIGASLKLPPGRCIVLKIPISPVY